MQNFEQKYVTLVDRKMKLASCGERYIKHDARGATDRANKAKALTASLVGERF